MPNTEHENNRVSDQLTLKNLLKIGIPVFVLATYVKYVMDKYKIELKEPPKEPQNGEKKQLKIIEQIDEILDQGDSIVGVLFPHTSMADHAVFNRELQRFSEYQSAWVATKKFKEGKMGVAGLLAQAWLHIDSKTKMFWVTQAYLRDNMDQEQADKARQDNKDSMADAVEFLSAGSSVLFFYPEGTRVRKSEDNEKKLRTKLSRAHPGAFTAAETAAQEGDKKIYLAPIHVGEVPDGKIKALLPAKTEVTYGEPLEITQLRAEYESLKGRIRFSKKAMEYHHPRNPAKKRAVNEAGIKQVDTDGVKLYSDEPTEFGFADYVMWKYSKLMPIEKRGIYSDECIIIE
jgi:hypothetical protein